MLVKSYCPLFSLSFIHLLKLKVKKNDVLDHLKRDLLLFVGLEIPEILLLVIELSFLE